MPSSYRHREARGELAVIEARARQTFDAAVYAAQASWHNENVRLHRALQDGLEDNAEAYRRALTQAQRAYRNATADTFCDATAD